MSALQLALGMVPAIGALAMLFLASWAFTGPPMAARREFGMLVASAGLWCLFAALEYLSVTWTPRYLFARAIYFGATTVPVAWVIFAARYTGWDRWLSRQLIFVLLVLPACTVLLAFTNEWHHLLWSQIRLVNDPIPDLDVVHGWWFDFVHVPYSYTLVIGGICILVAHFYRDFAAYRRQSIGVIISGVLVLSVNVAYTMTGASLYGLDPTPVFSSLFLLGLAYSLYQGMFRAAPLSYREVFMNTGDAVVLIGADGTIVESNPAAGYFGVSSAVYSGNIAKSFPWMANFNLMPDTESTSLHDHSIDGMQRVVEMKYCPLHNEQGVLQGAALLLRDVTSRERERALLEQMARQDSLTQALNHGAFMLAVEESLAARPTSRSLVLLYVDLNRFKQVNDRFGHAAGDQVLKETVHRIHSVLRTGDVLGRMGGDEFAVLVDRAEHIGAEELARRLNEAFSKGFVFAEQILPVSASIGHATWPGDGLTAKELIDVADLKMYQAKR